MGWKNMEIQRKKVLFVRRRSGERNKIKSSSGRYKTRGRYKSPGRFLKVCWRCGNKGITRNNVGSKVLREGRDMMMVLLQKKKPLQMKEGIHELFKYTQRS
jgi:hypothetical protein